MRLIDADALTKRLQHLWNIHDDVDFNNKDVWDELAIAPTIDAIEVVRCRDCKHLYEDDGCPLRYFKTHVEEDFCSYGERKVDG